MVPRPALTLTIPSIYDDTVLDCRIYAPPKLLARLKEERTEWRKKAAVVAHPYGPLGGCYDDPVVNIVAAGLLEDGFFVGTFNFRGAGGSKGRTSWTAKPEADDYISVIGLMVYFMHYLSMPDALLATVKASSDDEDSYKLTPIPSQALPPASSQDHQRHSLFKFSPGEQFDTGSIIKEGVSDEARPPRSKPLLLLGGYSYGALVTTRLPNLASILALFNTPELGTAASEIRLRAQQLAKEQSEIFVGLAAALQEEALKARNSRMSKNRRGRSLHTNSTTNSGNLSPTVGTVRHGGEETAPDLRRPSYDSQHRHSFSFEPERIRKSIDRVRSLGRRPESSNPASPPRRKRSTPSRRSSGSGSHSLDSTTPVDSAPSHDQRDMSMMPKIELEDLKISYLIISPPQGYVASLATVWSNPAREQSKDAPSKNPRLGSGFESKLVLNHTLAIGGDEDFFMSVKKLRAWAGRLGGQENSLFRHVVIAGGGHFWHEDGVVDAMMQHVMEFISAL